MHVLIAGVLEAIMKIYKNGLRGLVLTFGI